MFFYFYLISDSQLCSLNRKVKQSMKLAYAEGTYKNVRIQWKSFLIFCEHYQLDPFPSMFEHYACTLSSLVDLSSLFSLLEIIFLL